MVMKCEPLFAAVESLRGRNSLKRVVLMSPRGRRLDQAKVREFFAIRAQERKGNLEKKMALIARAEALADSTDWAKTTEELKRLQAEWQAVGNDTSSVVSDPLFVDPGNLDFTLDPASPAIVGTRTV